jgi:hypothetical protein
MFHEDFVELQMDHLTKIESPASMIGAFAGRIARG